MAKGVFLYTTDGGERIKVSLDIEKAAVGGFTAPASTDLSPVVPGFGKRMRVVYAENSSGSNFAFPMANQDIAAYATSSTTVITYKGSTLNTCSRRGERIYWGAPNAEGEQPLANPAAN